MAMNKWVNKTIHQGHNSAYLGFTRQMADKLHLIHEFIFIC